MKSTFLQKFLTSLLLMMLSFGTFAQLTTSSLVGSVKDTKGEALIGATVVAVHNPTGTNYGNITNENGLFNIQNMKVGGPYTINISYVGYKTYTLENVTLRLGDPMRLNIALLDDASVLSEVEVVYQKNAIINNQRNGASTNISTQTLNSLPTLSRSIQDFTKLTPQSNGLSFAGMDNRFNNITIDGSVFNNNFGLQALNGSQTSSTPISLDAIEEIQINLSPYDVRQGGFTGAGVNAVTRSGTNEFHGSAFYNLRNQNFVGKRANSSTDNVTVANFDVKQYGFRLGGPLIKNKLFFFVNGEVEQRSDPGTAYTSKKADTTLNNASSTTRVLDSDLKDLSAYLKAKYGYETGGYEGYKFNTASYKGLARLDYTINKSHSLTLRYNFLKSQKDIPVSNSGSSGGNRRDNLNAIAFENSNYIIHNDIQSVVGEWNSNFGSKYSNKLIGGFTANRDYRASNSNPFPLVDILNGGQSYMTFGYEPFTPNNVLNTDTWQLSDNFTAFLGKHTISAGASVEAFKFTNTFTPTLYGQFVFNSLADFYKSSDAYLANPTGKDTSVTLNKYANSFSALDDRSPWSAVTKATQIGAYIQDEMELTDNLRLTAGFRVDVPFFGNTAIENPQVPTLPFKDPEGNVVKLSTSALPSGNPNYSARFGFNWDPFKNKKTQFRGGMGLFSGRPAFVWISNQVGNNGMLSGSISKTNTKAYPFNPNTNAYAPATITRPPSSYNIAVTEDKFRFPQVFRTNIAVDQKLGWGVVGTLEAMYSRTVNDMFYYQANLQVPTTRFSGADNRFRYPASRNINSNITDATVLSNSGSSYNYFFTAQLDKSFSKNLFVRVAYNYSVAKDLMSAGSIAFSSWSQNQSVNGNNYPDLSLSGNDLRHRLIAVATYKLNWGSVASTQFSVFGEGRVQSNYSFTYTGDYNLDGISGNDLIYVPKDANDANQIKFADILKSDGSVQFTADQQKAAWTKFVDQNDYLKSRVGNYFERNGGLMPWVYNFDVSVVQEFYLKLGSKTHTLQVRGDIFNFGNLLNNKWGVGKSLNTSNPLRVALDKTGKAVAIPADNIPLIQMTPVNGSLDYTTYRSRATLGDVWTAQLGVRYIF